MQQIPIAEKGSCRNIRRQKPPRLQVDMTPMVDLGFLLITFFIFTSTLSKPAITDLYMPADGPPSTLSEKNAVTVILPGNNRLIYYQGSFTAAIQKKMIREESMANKIRLRRVLQQLRSSGVSGDGHDPELMLLIKPAEKATYGDIIGMLDEVLICDVKKYAIVPPGDAELNYLQLKD